MKIKVKRMDIELGRDNAGNTCGCPIHIALCRALSVPSEIVRIPNIHYAQIGKMELLLPIKAVTFQETLMSDRDARVKPFEFILGD